MHGDGQPLFWDEMGGSRRSGVQQSDRERLTLYYYMRSPPPLEALALLGSPIRNAALALYYVFYGLVSGKAWSSEEGR